ncbi:MAG: transposase, partial [Aestuariivita sp.]|nr:transposase [Aestuariivita sp.]
GQVDPATERYKQRSSVERVNGALKDRYGGRHIRVQGATKVACHLFFGILALTVEQLLRLQI